MAGKAKTTYTIQWVEHMSDIGREEWDALAEPLATPILEWEWLHQMEKSGSIRPETGWLPFHLTVRSGGRLVGAAPLYIKGHSAGEFVFDYAWAEVAGKLGVSYYPKIVGMSPATPSVGYRFLIAPGEEEERMTGVMLNAIDNLCRKHRISGCSFLFVDPEWSLRMEQLGCRSWLHQNFSWQNRGYETFDDYLAVFNKNQRRNIKRERRMMESSEIRIEHFTGDAIPKKYLSLMYTFYERTNEQFGPWAAKYLTREFFEGLYEGYRHRLLLTAAFSERGQGEPLGMSFLLTKGDLLIGRYWGSFERINSLHFNVCYYAPMEWAISRGARIFDPGIGSVHKIWRGFHAVANYSLHRFYDERLDLIMKMNMDRINRLEQEQIDSLNQSLPYPKGKRPGRKEEIDGDESTGVNP